MTSSPTWSTASAPCRLEWRPSRWLLLALVLLTAGAAVSLLASDLPRTVAWGGALAALLYGLRVSRSELRRPPRLLVAPGDCTKWRIDGQPMPGLVLKWRGPLLFVHWRGPAGRERLAWWPDTLRAPQRRELRLAAPAPGTARDAGSMAP
ncbi:hypothetical protein [Lysobacter sp. A3-1-A15]|uniref:hypothetical protein n=1 Tax=Novilysobacter viscosus TaxID=3098602 RepID=UPI002EDA0754